MNRCSGCGHIRISHTELGGCREHGRCPCTAFEPIQDAPGGVGTHVTEPATAIPTAVASPPLDLARAVQQAVQHLRGLGWTRAQIARAVGVDRRSLYAWSAGRAQPTTAHLAALRRLAGSAREPLWAPAARALADGRLAPLERRGTVRPERTGEMDDVAGPPADLTGPPDGWDAASLRAELDETRRRLDQADRNCEQACADRDAARVEVGRLLAALRLADSTVVASMLDPSSHAAAAERDERARRDLALIREATRPYDDAEDGEDGG